MLDVLSSLCEGNGVVVRSSQNTIANNLLPGRDLLLQTTMIDHVSSMMPNVMVGVVEGSAWFRKWYFEAEVDHLEQMTKQAPYLRIGWANTQGYNPYPGSGEHWGGNGVGDDLFSFGFDGRDMWCGAQPKRIGTRELRKGDVIGCAIDLNVPEVTFSLNGELIQGAFRHFNIDGYFYPVMSLSAKVSCRFVFGGDQGRLRYGPAPGYSALYEAVRGTVEIVPCFTFGSINKQLYSGPSTAVLDYTPFVPEPKDIEEVSLPHFAQELHTKLAENMHELWAMHKIENGWIWGDRRDETERTHPCIAPYADIPDAEKAYNVNLALDSIKTIHAMGYHMNLDKPPIRIRPMRLPNSFAQANGYKPAPMDVRELELNEAMLRLVEELACNTHKVWAREKISRGWTYGVNEDFELKRSPHLVPYEHVDERIKTANRETAAETILTLMLHGLFLDPPAIEHDYAAARELEALNQKLRTYRAEKPYGVSAGKWYFEFEILTTGFMKVGWMDINAVSDHSVGEDDTSFGFDGYLIKKWHTGPEHYGKAWKPNDVIGCFLDLNDRTVSFSLNGELLLDPSGAEMAFDNIPIMDGFVPAFSLGPGQRARLNFGQDANSLKFFTTCGLQEGYEPFCVNMYRRLPLWYNRQLALFESFNPETSPLEIVRVPASPQNPPCLKVAHRLAAEADKVPMEFIRLSLPVKCHAAFTKNKPDREAMHLELDKMASERMGLYRPASPPLISDTEDEGGLSDGEDAGPSVSANVTRNPSQRTEGGAESEGEDGGRRRVKIAGTPPAPLDDGDFDPTADEPEAPAIRSGSQEC